MTWSGAGAFVAAMVLLVLAKTPKVPYCGERMMWLRTILLILLGLAVVIAAIIVYGTSRRKSGTQALRSSAVRRSRTDRSPCAGTTLLTSGAEGWSAHDCLGGGP
jgi:hypothetical protein